MRHRYLPTLLACALAAVPALAAHAIPPAAEEPAPVAGAPARIPGARQFDLVSARGHAYRVFVAEPQGTAPEGGYPVLYMLDGNAVFGTAVEAARLQQASLGPVLVVAVGYPVDTPFDGPSRYRDYTPRTDPRHLPAHFDAGLATGGQDDFLDFLDTRVRPLVESLYPVDRRRQALFGHSLGGRLVLHALFTRPRMFQRYVAGSPSIWWDGRSILAERDRFAALPPEERRDVSLMVVVGGEELGHIVLDARNLVTSLPPIRNRYEEIPGEGHVSMLPAAINGALRFVLDKPH